MSAAPRRLDFGEFKAHEGCPERGYPGGQVAFIEACLTTKVVCALNGRDTGKSISAGILFWEEGRLTSGPYEFVNVLQGHPQAEREYEAFLKLCETAGPGFVTDRANKGQNRFVEIRSFGRNSGAKRHFWSGEPGALTNVRGPRANRLLVDEAGFVHRSVKKTCLPMLGSRNGKAAFIGTADRSGMGWTWFKETFERGLKESETYDPDYVSFNFPKESNPYLSDEAILFERRSLRDPSHPDVKTAEEMEECDGAFVSNMGAYFRNLDAAFCLPFKKIDHGFYVRTLDGGALATPIPGRRYCLGQDWARKYDRSVSSVFDRLTREQVALRVEPIQKSYDEYVTRLSALKRHWNDALVIADDRGSGEYANSRLASVFGDRYRGVSLTGQGENSKGGYAARMRDMFDMGSWKFLDVKDQKDEFSAYEQTPIGESQNGWNYGAPSGKHDDMVSAAMFASTVLQIDPPRVRRKAEEVAVYSTEWFAQKAKERRKVVARRGIW